MYTIEKVLHTFPPTYKLKTDRGDVMEGSFYEPELQLKNEEHFLIEKILRWKKIKGKKHGLIKWVGYDDSYNTWKAAKKIKDLKDI